MTTYQHWHKSSYSDGDDGNDCVEIASSPTRVGIRDSKTPGGTPLTVPMEAFAGFVEAVKKGSLPLSC